MVAVVTIRGGGGVDIVIVNTSRIQWLVYITPLHPPGADFQARVLDNQEGANTERYVLGKLSARCLQRRPAPTLLFIFRLWRYRVREIGPGGAGVMYTVVCGRAVVMVVGLIINHRISCSCKMSLGTKTKAAGYSRCNCRRLVCVGGRWAASLFSCRSAGWSVVVVQHSDFFLHGVFIFFLVQSKLEKLTLARNDDTRMLQATYKRKNTNLDGNV